MRLTINHLRKLDMALLPPEGGWVMLVGNPYAPRGRRIPQQIAGLGLDHLDIVYAVDETVKFDLPLPKDFDKLSSPYQAEAIAEALDYSGITDMQLTALDIAFPGTRYFIWRGEVRAMEENFIAALLAEDMVEVHRFDQHNPVLEESVRDIVDALQVDGLTFAEAQAEALGHGVIKLADLSLPAHFYRPAGQFRDMFVEA